MREVNLSDLKSHILFSKYEFDHFIKRGDTYIEIMAYWDHGFELGQCEPTKKPTNKTLIGEEMSCSLKPFHQEYRDCYIMAK